MQNEQILTLLQSLSVRLEDNNARLKKIEEDNNAGRIAITAIIDRLEKLESSKKNRNLFSTCFSWYVVKMLQV